MWIVDTPANRAAAERAWKEQPGESHQNGITISKDAECTREELFLSMLVAIDIHHGRYSHDPPYTALQVYGASLTDAVRAELRDYGFDEFRPGANGFWASRPTTSEDWQSAPPRQGTGVVGGCW